VLQLIHYRATTRRSKEARDIPSSREKYNNAQRRSSPDTFLKETFISNWVTDRYLIKRYEKNEILGRPRVGATEQLPITRELRRPRSHRTVGELFVYVLLVLILCLLCVRNLCSSFFIPFFSFHFGKDVGTLDEMRDARGTFFIHSLSIILTAACSPPLFKLLRLRTHATTEELQSESASGLGE